MSASAAIASSAVSTLYRIVVYLFLQVVPKGEAKYLIPALYALYVVFSYSAVPVFSHLVAVKKEVVAGESKEKNGHPVTDVSLSETPVVVPLSEPFDWSSALTTIIFSVPSPIRALRLANLAINTLLLLAVADFVAVPYFDDASGVVYTRVGALYPDAAKIVVRYPAHNATDNLVRLSWRQVNPKATSNDAPWRDGPTTNLTSDLDWVQTVRLSGLWPKTTYEYRFHDANNTLLSYPPEPIRFRTFPDPRLSSGSNFRFIASSCMTPNFPYMPFQGRRLKGLDLLADYIWPPEPSASTAPDFETPPDSVEELEGDRPPPPELRLTPAPPPPEFMIFMGDFIYADVPVYFGDDAEAYRRLYRRNYNSPSFRKVYERLPIFHTYDDHEIINNYVGQGNVSREPFPNAADAFSLYNADANYESPEEGQYYYDFRYGDAAYFVMDTRKYRSDITSEDPSVHTMLGDKQLGALYNWLGKVNQTVVFKFIVTSVPFTSLWTHDAQTDSWAAYPTEKASLLAALHTVPNVIILSGDRHEFAAIEYESGDVGHKVLEISTSPMSMFYVPWIRTLRPHSAEVVNKTVEDVIIAEDGTKDVTQYVVEVPREKVIKYIGEGNYKWASIEVDTSDYQHPVVNVEIMIDGKPAYKLEVTGKPVKMQSSTSVGALLPSSFQSMLDMIGLKPGKWF
ncbi:PhoD-like phosphatase-domain-containing protein [Epithele typhae]|uniref:PhoD-like phosphatase-domain-containing protein n=1 Tax=Epithele typhae TaxID=378194 RepID=UPI002007D288|nr:PhoD-like phosphatase-domain-containing protein [Epithele typhae]KAH9924002.1 PhoD-like phosphatase-domain-containing protein [Epithele typhae]